MIADFKVIGVEYDLFEHNYNEVGGSDEYGNEELIPCTDRQIDINAVWLNDSDSTEVKDFNEDKIIELIMKREFH